MKDDDKIIQDLLRSIEMDIEPPKGIKEQIFANIMLQGTFSSEIYEPKSMLEKMLFVSPWRVTVPASLIISYIASLAMGNSFNKIVGTIFGLGGI